MSRNKYQQHFDSSKLTLPPWGEERPKAPNIMVLDTCSLIRLATPIPKGFFHTAFPEEKRPKTYLDLLHLLPKDIVSEIHIPSVVVKELIGWNYTISDTNKVVSWQVNPRIEQKFSNYEVCKGFLDKALRGQDPVIKIIYNKEMEEHIGEVAYRIAQLDAEHPSGEEHRKRIEDARRVLRKEAKDLGEVQCVNHALGYAIAHDASVAMVTDDGWGQGLLQHAVDKQPHKHDMDVWLLNCRGLVLGFKTSGLMEQVGIRSDISTKEHVRYITNSLESRSCRNMEPLVDMAPKQAHHRKMLGSFVERVRQSAMGARDSEVSL